MSFRLPPPWGDDSDGDPDATIADEARHQSARTKPALPPNDYAQSPYPLAATPVVRRQLPRAVLVGAGIIAGIILLVFLLSVGSGGRWGFPFFPRSSAVHTPAPPGSPAIQPSATTAPATTTPPTATTTVADCALTPNNGTPPPNHIDQFNVTLPTNVRATFSRQEDTRTTLSANGTAIALVQRIIHLCPQNQLPFASLRAEIMAGIKITGSSPWAASQASICGTAVICLHLSAQTTYHNPFDEYISLAHTPQNDNGGILTLSFALITGHDMLTPDHSITLEPGTPADIDWSSSTQILIVGCALAVTPATSFDLNTVTLDPIQHCGSYINDGTPHDIGEQRLLCASTQEALFAAVKFGGYTGTGIPVDWVLFPAVFW